jgi:hypothetical protein
MNIAIVDDNDTITVGNDGAILELKRLHNQQTRGIRIRATEPILHIINIMLNAMGRFQAQQRLW